ncbi:MAG: hypothetical protein Q9P44_19325 [Anaerolineae bacterium]|nr:hypothetical protein [Anaerolineae bacterium]
MSNEQHELPDNFNVKLQRHGENWHVTRLAGHEYEIGNKAAQPPDDTVLSNLAGMGYEVAWEANMPSTLGNRIITFGRVTPPSVFETTGDDMALSPDIPLKPFEVKTSRIQMMLKSLNQGRKVSSCMIMANGIPCALPNMILWIELGTCRGKM